MALLSTIQFGDYVFPPGFRLASWANDARLETAQLSGVDGVRILAGRADQGTISVEGSMGGSGDPGFSVSSMLTADDFAAECNALYQRLASGYQQLTVGIDPARTIRCQKSRFSTEFEESMGRRFGAIKVEFVAPDPRWLSTAVKTVTGNGVAVHAGSARSYPVFTITGPSTNPSVSVEPAGYTGSVTVGLTVTLASTDTIVIDCDPRNRMFAVLLNGVRRLDLIGVSGINNGIGTADCFPFLLPGNNGVGFSGGGGYQMAWQDAWGF